MLVGADIMYVFTHIIHVNSSVRSITLRSLTYAELYT